MEKGRGYDPKQQIKSEGPNTAFYFLYLFYGTVPYGTVLYGTVVENLYDYSMDNDGKPYQQVS